MGALGNYFVKKYADKRRFKRDELYVGILSSTSKILIDQGRTIQRYGIKYHPNRFLILETATEEEVSEYLKKTFGSRPGIIYPENTVVDWSKVPIVVSDLCATYYKSPTMSNIIFPLTSLYQPHKESNTVRHIPHLEMLYGKAIPLTNMFAGNIQLAEKLSLNELIELETYMNNYTNVYEVAQNIEKGL